MDGVADDWELIAELASWPAAGDPAAVDTITELARPGVVYDVLVVMCREIVRLRLEVQELQRLLQLAAN